MKVNDYLMPLREAKYALDEVVKIFEGVDIIYLDLAYIHRILLSIASKIDKTVKENKSK